MLGDSVNIKNLNCNLVVLKKKLVKTLKIAIFGSNLRTKKLLGWATNKMKKKFLCTNNKSRLQDFKNSLFYKNIICFGCVMNLFLIFVMAFFCQKGSLCAHTGTNLGQIKSNVV